MKIEDLRRVITIKKKGEFIDINIDDIILCVADGNNSDIYTKKATYKTIRMGLGEIWAKVKDDKLHYLKKVGKYYIMNIDAIDTFNPSKRTIRLKNYVGKIVMPVSDAKTTKKISAEGDISISTDAMIKLMKDLNVKLQKEKQFEPLIRQKLTVSNDQLNSEHLMASGNEYVDMGLPSGTKWSVWNLGTGPSSNGRFFQWNSYFPSDSYDLDGYKPAKGDCVNILWGDNWRMSTLKDFEELEKNCLLTWCISDDDVFGCLVTAKNGNRIFFPAYGMMKGKDKDILNKNKDAIYWTSDCSKDDKVAQSFYFNEDLIYNNKPTGEASCISLENKRTLGLCIRPVINEVKNASSKQMKLLVVRNYDFPEEVDFRYKSYTLNCHSYEAVLPNAPQQAMSRLQKICDKMKPDLVLGEGTGCFFVHQLKDYKRLLVDPIWYPSQVLLQDEYAEELEFSKEIIDQFAKMELNQFANVGNIQDCWMGFSEWDDNSDKFCEYYEDKNAYELCEYQNYWTNVNQLIMKIWGRI